MAEFQFDWASGVGLPRKLYLTLNLGVVMFFDYLKINFMVK
jgi:hypothetical protein